MKATVIEALAFRGAGRYVAEVLITADDKTYDLVVAKGLIADIPEGIVQQDVKAARERWRKAGVSHYDRLRSIIYAQGNEDRGAEVTAIVAEMDIDGKRDGGLHILYEVHKRYPQALAAGLFRVRYGRTLFYGADDILGSTRFALEDDALAEIALPRRVITTTARRLLPRCWGRWPLAG